MEQKTALKTHFSRPTFSDSGHENPDYRGDKKIGRDESDHHGTIAEIDPFDLSGADDVLTGLLADLGVVIPGEIDVSGIGEEFLLKLLAEMNKTSCKEVAPGVFMGTRTGLWPGDGRV